MIGTAINSFIAIIRNRTKTMLIVFISLSIAISGVLYGLSLYELFYELDSRGLNYRLDIISGNNTIDDYDRKLEKLLDMDKVNSINLYVESNTSRTISYSYFEIATIVQGSSFDEREINQIILPISLLSRNALMSEEEHKENLEKYKVGQTLEIGDEEFLIVGFSIDSLYYINRYAAKNYEFECARFNLGVKDSSKNVKKYNAIIEELLDNDNNRIYYERPIAAVDAVFAPLANAGFICSIIIVILASLNIIFQYGHILDYNKSINRTMKLSGISIGDIYKFNIILSLIISLISFVIGELIYLLIRLVVSVDVRISVLQHFICLGLIALISSIITGTILYKQLRGMKGGRI